MTTENRQNVVLISGSGSSLENDRFESFTHQVLSKNLSVVAERDSVKLRAKENVVKTEVTPGRQKLITAWLLPSLFFETDKRKEEFHHRKRRRTPGKYKLVRFAQFVAET